MTKPLEPIRFALSNLYAAKNVHGYSTWRGPDTYESDPWHSQTVRTMAPIQLLEVVSVHNSGCPICGTPWDDNHKFKVVRLTNEKGLLLNEDGTLLKIKHDRPNTVGRITRID